jgi:hypothetical protein
MGTYCWSLLPVGDVMIQSWIWKLHLFVAPSALLSPLLLLQLIRTLLWHWRIHTIDDQPCMAAVWWGKILSPWLYRTQNPVVPGIKPGVHFPLNKPATTIVLRNMQKGIYFYQSGPAAAKFIYWCIETCRSQLHTWLHKSASWIYDTCCWCDPMYMGDHRLHSWISKL